LTKSSRTGEPEGGLTLEDLFDLGDLQDIQDPPCQQC